MTTKFNRAQLALRGLTYHWKIHLTVGLGVAAATAVLTGALLVGDSVRGSLRHLTLDRLGQITDVLVQDRFFAADLVARWNVDPTTRAAGATGLGVMLFTDGTVERTAGDQFSLAGNVNVLGTPASQTAGGRSPFWDLDISGVAPSQLPGVDEIVLNAALAAQLQARVGDLVTLHLPKPAGIPADSPLGEKADRIRSLPRLRVVDVVPAEGLGAFNLRASQQVPLNAYLALETIQLALRQQDKVNAILVSARPADTDNPAGDRTARFTAALQPMLGDLGLAVRHAQLSYQPPDGQVPEVIYDYFSLSSSRMILPPEVEQAADHEFGPVGGQPVLTYLANKILKCDAQDQPIGQPLPYSLIAGLDLSPGFHLTDCQGRPLAPLTDGEIVLTSWAAEDLAAQVGDTVRITYFEPETTHGTATETSVALRVQAITPLTAPERPYLPARRLVFSQRPTLANDPDLTPEVEGITDQRSIDDWEVPFTIDYSLVRSQDDTYWEEYGTTPKAFVSLATARRLWGSRFGQATSYRIPVTPHAAAANAWTAERVGARIRDRLAQDGRNLGFEFQPIRLRQLQASAGNTPFDVLFLMLSFFVIVAALMLVALLFRLGFEQRARQAGLLLASGWQRRQVRNLFWREGLVAAAAGGLLGLLIGAGYAWLMLAALSSESWWLGAISTPFLQFYATPRSLAIGYVAGVATSALTIAWCVWQTRHLATSRLLAGQTDAARDFHRRPSRWPAVLALGLAVGAAALAIAATRLSGQAQAGAFVGAGAALLAAALLGCWQRLRTRRTRRAVLLSPLPLASLAARTAARNPVRSTLTIGLIATASFLIVAMSAFQLRPTESGTAGFSLVADTSQPLLRDLNRPADREDLLGGDAGQLAGCTTFSFRVRPGDDASCGNLYQAAQPRVLGVPDGLLNYFDDPDAARFAWTATATESAAEHANPWQLLRARGTPEGPVPVVIDHDTAAYSLHLYGGIGQEFSVTYDDRPVTFRVVGLLSVSVLHGNLLIANDDFQRLFPDVSGYRYFLLKTPPEAAERIRRILERSLQDQGFDAADAQQVLAGLLALQNTYLKTFQSLGALGLLLGTFGLGVVQWRSVLERRGEMALLRATGFANRRLFALVLLENFMLLLGGLAIGAGTALMAVLPYMLAGGAAVPFAQLALMLGAILLVGVLAGSLAARATLRAPLLAALREER